MLESWLLQGQLSSFLWVRAAAYVSQLDIHVSIFFASAHSPAKCAPMAARSIWISRKVHPLLLYENQRHFVGEKCRTIINILLLAATCILKMIPQSKKKKKNELYGSKSC
jgi:hypothetical protein